MEKLYYEQNTNSYHKTLKAAKEHAAKKGMCPYISRVWTERNKILGECIVFAYGESACPVRWADSYIENEIRNQEEI